MVWHEWSFTDDGTLDVYLPRGMEDLAEPPIVGATMTKSTRTLA